MPDLLWKDAGSTDNSMVGSRTGEGVVVCCMSWCIGRNDDDDEMMNTMWSISGKTIKKKSLFIVRGLYKEQSRPRRIHVDDMHRTCRDTPGRVRTAEQIISP